NLVSSKKLAKTWYQYALPKHSIQRPDFVRTSHECLARGGCFCVSSLVQGLMAEEKTVLEMNGVPATLVWGAKDFSHRMTDKHTIKNHIKDCEIVEFKNCGHFPELEDAGKFVKLISEKIRK
ncbi:MAG TPA: alpha/beta hydrolase, partial [Flavobacterium sp.]|nr:alpha/beta hydrolase [Flavobacterium sp.]